MKDFFTNPNAFEDYLNSDEPEPEVREYAKDEKFRKYWVERLGRDGFEGAQCYYKATRENHQSASDAALPKENYKVNVPFLYIGCGMSTPLLPFLLPSLPSHCLP